MTRAIVGVDRPRTAQPAGGERAAFGAGAALLLALLVLAGVALALDWLLRPDRFVIEHVYFEGPFEHVQREQLVRSVKEHVHVNFFALDLDVIKARVESLPWVYRASVRRQWPDELYIRFSEQRLAARWGEGDWINEAGELVRNVQADASALGVPRLVGPEGMHAQVLEAYRRLAQALAPLGRRPAAVTLSPRRTWELRLDDGVVLVLGREHVESRVARFVRAYPRALAAAQHDIRQVDLRHTNGFSVRWGEAPAQAARAEPTHRH